MEHAGKPGGHTRGTLRRTLVTAMIIVFLSVFALWRIEGARVETVRAEIIDRVVPSFSWIIQPVTTATEMWGTFQRYSQLYEQNQELRRELQQMKAWKEAALQLEQENALLLSLNKVHLDPKYTHVTGMVLADSGSPFRQSVLINLGRRDGVIDGWAAMDSIGLVGRISGVGERTSRVVLLSDTSSRLPVMIQPSGERALLSGDGSARPVLELIDNRQLVRPGDRIVTSGDGKVFPPDLLVGEVAESPDRRLRAVLLADYERLKFLRVLRSQARERITDTGDVIVGADVAPSPPQIDAVGDSGE